MMGTPTEAVLETPSPSKIREELVALFYGELLGPAGGAEEEVSEGRVSERYLCGMLAPKRNVDGAASSADEPDSLHVAGEGKDDGLAVAGVGEGQDGATEDGVPQRESMQPSSFGMTFTLSEQCEALRITAQWGRYGRVESETQTTKEGNPLRVWKRVPMSGVSEPIPLVEGTLAPWVVHEDYPEVHVRGVMRRRDDGWIVTLFLVNGQLMPASSKDGAWLFQAELSVESADGAAVFVKRLLRHDGARMDLKDKIEQDALHMLYRDEVEFAVGHGVAVHAETLEGNPQQAVGLCTRAIPRYEVPRTDAPTVEDNPDLLGLELDMKALAEADGATLKTKLDILADGYEKWIGERRREIGDPTSGLAPHRQAAERAMEHCVKALARIREGVALLGADGREVEAFRFANRAMWLQRIHTIYAEKVRRGEGPKLEDVDVPENRSWRPFQLAFVLLNLPSCSDLHHEDRSHAKDAVADLLWFPTGGGKTEAYLGLAAYVMGLRRLQGVVGDRSGEAGVAVIMRYTLRLLTLQQFQRASALICACESIRREKPERWGAEPFRIGLWVGQKTTPNWTDDSAEAIRHSRGRAAPGGSGTPHQLTNCPWCGTPIDPGSNIMVETYRGGRARTIVYCGDPLGHCEFSSKLSPEEGIPVLVVDDEIYRRLPTLLIATVDKFAQMPWNGRTQMLFGQVNGYCSRHGYVSPEMEDAGSHPARGNLPKAQCEPRDRLRPPDLIIQDELHLISGPLGTLVGLYETAVDELCTWEVEGKRVRPKVIASTATIRRAPDQIHALFLRKVEVFPPHGVDVKDNFFSVQRPVTELHPGRAYLGVCAPGIRSKATLIRVYTALLAASQYLYDKYGADADTWMTLVGYFNSLRELGGMRRLVDDDVRSRLQDMDTRRLARRNAPLVEELTSRMHAVDIPRTLDRLEVGFDPQREALRRQKRKEKKKDTSPRPIDVLLATNMISVGVDVQRLGLMVVAGQPKNTAEYIQATSRVGRRDPGLVVTVYNWARPRDLSHYETFEHYHATFYQHVEALSVTPFAMRALDRGLSALLVSLIRLAGEDLNDNPKAQDIDRNHPFVRRAMDTIIARAEMVTEKTEVADEVRSMLENRLDVWLAEAQKQEGSVLGYKKPRKATGQSGTTRPLLKDAGDTRWEKFTCLNSLRDVEPAVSLILEEGDGEVSE